MKRNFDTNEFAAIRNEISMRIQLINTQENTALLMAAGLWTVGTALSTISTVFLLSGLISVFLLYVPILLLIPISIKSGENLYQIEVLSTYVKVFYEYTSLAEERNRGKIFFWEFANGAASKINKKQKNISTYTFFLNNAYCIISLISLIIYSSKAISLLIEYGQYFLSLKWWIAVIFFVLSLAIGTILTIKINTWSSVKNNMKGPEKEIIETFVKDGIALGIFEDEKFNDIVDAILNGDLNIKKGQESTIKI